MDTIKYYLHLQIEPDLMVSLRVYERDPRKFGGSGSIEAVRMINYDTGQLDPVKVRFNVGFSNKDGYGYTLQETDEIIAWIGVAKLIARCFDTCIKNVADFERVALKPFPGYPSYSSDKIEWGDWDGQIVINYPKTTMENVRPVEAGR